MGHHTGITKSPQTSPMIVFYITLHNTQIIIDVKIIRKAKFQTHIRADILNIFCEKKKMLKVQKVLFIAIITLYLEGPKNDINNYRPVSLLSCLYKLFSKVIRKD